MTPSASKSQRHVSTSFEVFYDDPIVVQTVHPYATMDVAAAQETLRLGRLILGDASAPILVDLRAPCSIDVAARSIFASADLGDIFCAVALLTNNPITRLAANLLLKVDAPPYPARMFSDEADARRWLSNYVN